MLGTRIAAQRARMGISQMQLARRLHISPSAVGMYEQGRREPPAEMLVALSREFGVSVDYLLTGRESFSKPEMTEMELKDIFDMLLGLYARG